MKKFAVLLTMLVLFGVFTLGALAVTSTTDSIEFTAYEILYKIGVIDTFESTVLTENAVPYLHLTSKAGTYGNTEYVISFSSLRGNFNMLDYPYIKLEYRTDSPTTILDTTVTSAKGENWPSSKPSQVTDGNYHTVILNVNTMFSVADKTPEYSDGTKMSFRLKPMGSGSKILKDDYFFDIKYIAFFKTEAAARAHTYTYDSSNDEFINTKLDYAPLTSAVERSILAGSEELKQTILNSESISPSSISGTVYYVANNGDDANDGTSQSSPLASLEAVNKLELEPGDGVFFKRGDTFRGQLKIREGVTYSSYGTGEKAKLYHSIPAADPDCWMPTQYKNIWVYTEQISSSNDIGNIIFNDGEAWGIKVTRQNDTMTRLYQATVYNGYESFVSEGAFTDERHLVHNLEFWHSWDTDQLFMYCDYGNPGDVFDSIEMSLGGNLISGKSVDVTIDNLALGYTGSHGIGVGSSKDFTVQYCTFKYIGGSIQMYTDGRATLFGNAVENWGSCDGYTIDHCYASQVYDCCFTTQWQGTGSKTDIIMKNVVFSNTISEYSNSGPEVWLSANDKDDTHTYLIENMEAYNNYVLNGGYGWSNQRPNKDGNFFYGGSAGETTRFVNVEYHDNFFYKAISIAIKARYSKLGYGYNFRDNVFVMAEGLAMVETGSDLSNCSGNTVRYEFNEDDLRLLTYNGFFPNCKFYYYDIADAGLPMPENDPPRDPNFVFVPAATLFITDYVLLEADDLLEYADSSVFKGMSYDSTLKTDENDISYFRINSIAGSYKDEGSYYDLPLKALGKEISVHDYPYIRIGYRTNITGSSSSVFNYVSKYQSLTTRLWGTNIGRISDSELHYALINVETTTHAGNGITDFDWSQMAPDAIYDTLHLKLWGAHDIDVNAGEYYDIAYIAFFKNKLDMHGYVYPEIEVKLVGDINNDGNVDSLDALLLSRYISSMQGYLSPANLRAGDVNADNKITPLDPVILSRHIANWSSYTELPYSTAG